MSAPPRGGSPGLRAKRSGVRAGSLHPAFDGPQLRAPPEQDFSLVNADSRGAFSARYRTQLGSPDRWLRLHDLRRSCLSPQSTSCTVCRSRAPANWVASEEFLFGLETSDYALRYTLVCGEIPRPGPPPRTINVAVEGKEEDLVTLPAGTRAPALQAARQERIRGSFCVAFGLRPTTGASAATPAQ